MYQRGDVVSVPFPFTDLTEAKLRPALIISNEIVNTTGEVIIVMITSKQRNEIVSIAINDGDVAKPLPKNSFINCHRVATLSALLIRKKITQASPGFVEKVVGNIAFLIGEFKQGLSVEAPYED